MLSLPSGVISALESGRFAVRIMARFDLTTGAVGIWNDTYDVSLGGVTYTALGPNLQLAPISSRSQLGSEQVELTASHVSPDVGSIIDGIDWAQQPATIFRAFLDDAGAVLHAQTFFSGFLDHVTIADAADDTATVRMLIESNNRELSRANGRLRSDNDQRLIGANDGFFKHAVASAVDSEIYWGRKGPQKVKK